MKRICLLTMTMHIVTCITTDSSMSPVNQQYPTTSLEPPLGTHNEVTAVSPQLVSAHQKTEAPMLGYIFDTHSNLNKHHHHDHKWGPHFEEMELGANATNITVQVGSTANLNCRISLLQDKTVSWVRRKHGKDDLQLLTVGLHTYSGDNRYTVEFQYPNNWRLQIKFTNKRDEGTYECQISTHPPKVTQIHLHINAPEVTIVDEEGRPLHDKYYEAESTIQLSCIVRHVVMTSSVVSWHHGDRMLNYDTTRGGISVKTDLMEEGANSSLSVAHVNKTDSGNYTCSISQMEFATVTVHVLNGGSLAELHHGSWSPMAVCPEEALLLLCLIVATVSHFRLASVSTQHNAIIPP